MVTAKWCGPCMACKPAVILFNQTVPRDKKVKFVDITDKDSPAVKAKVQELGIRSIPTFIVKKDGKEITRYIGPVDYLTIERLWNLGEGRVPVHRPFWMFGNPVGTWLFGPIYVDEKP